MMVKIMVRLNRLLSEDVLHFNQRNFCRDRNPGGMVALPPRKLLWVTIKSTNQKSQCIYFQMIWTLSRFFEEQIFDGLDHLQIVWKLSGIPPDDLKTFQMDWKILTHLTFDAEVWHLERFYFLVLWHSDTSGPTRRGIILDIFQRYGIYSLYLNFSLIRITYRVNRSPYRFSNVLNSGSCELSTSTSSSRCKQNLMNLSKQKLTFIETQSFIENNLHLGTTNYA